MAARPPFLWVRPSLVVIEDNNDGAADDDDEMDLNGITDWIDEHANDEWRSRKRVGFLLETPGLDLGIIIHTSGGQWLLAFDVRGTGALPDEVNDLARWLGRRFGVVGDRPFHIFALNQRRWRHQPSWILKDATRYEHVMARQLHSAPEFLALDEQDWWNIPRAGAGAGAGAGAVGPPPTILDSWTVDSIRSESEVADMFDDVTASTQTWKDFMSRMRRRLTRL